MRLDTRPIPEGRSEIRAFVCLRNEAIRLPFFLAHYRQLGVDRFFVVDNGSTDGTVDALLAEPDVHVISEPGSYAESEYGMHWVRRVMSEFGQERWCIVVDADELLIYPDVERVSLRGLTGYLERRGCDALHSVLLDMYADKPFAETRIGEARRLQDACPFYETESIRVFGAWPPELQPHEMLKGGMRERVFDVPTALDKVSVMKLKPGVRINVGMHAIQGAVLADIRGAVLHYKFLEDFVDKAVEEAVRGEHWKGAQQYSRYADVLAETPDLSAYYPGSRRLTESMDLLVSGVMRRTDAYARDTNQ